MTRRLVELGLKAKSKAEQLSICLLAGILFGVVVVEGGYGHSSRGRDFSHCLVGLAPG